METAKIKANFSEGLFEAEGSEAFVREAYKGFQDILERGPFPRPLPKEEELRKEEKQTTKPQESYTILHGLDLSARNNRKGLKEFFLEKAPATAFEKNVVFVYYLQKIRGTPFITPDHLYTCYKHANAKLPTAFRQSILDTSYKKYLLDTSSLKDIRLTVAGENFVDYELPKRR